MALLPALLALALSQAKVPEPLELRTQRAIDAGVAYLLGNEQPGGTWSGGHGDGSTALVLYTLLKSGVPDHEVAVLDAVTEVYALDPPTATYDTALAILALAAHDGQLHAQRIRLLADTLIGWQSGGWGYPDRGDLSNTQYAALGLWAAGRAGMEVPLSVWRRLFTALGEYRSNRGGFCYRTGLDPTGSMTTAGIGTLAICADGLRAAHAFGEKEEKRAAEWAQGGLEWLSKHFSVSTNPEGGAWHYYYLYGLERMGALANVTSVGEHDWYREGAEFLLDAQRVDGGWCEDGAASNVLSTCFALLFLKRATRPVTAVAAPSASKRAGILAQDALVRVIATGEDPVTLWIEGFADEVLERLEWPNEVGRGLHIARVVYFASGEPIASVEGEADQPAGFERFAVQHHFESEGRQRLRAEVLVLAPPADAAARAASRSQMLRSADFVVEIGDPSREGRRAHLLDRHDNLVPMAKARAAATSTWKDGSPLPWPSVGAANAVDGKLGTPWLADPDDRHPILTLTFSDAPMVHRIVVTNAISRPYRSGALARAAEIGLTINGDQFQRLHMPYYELRKARLELAAPTRIRTLAVEILWSVPGETYPAVGLAEVELQ